MKIIFHHDFYEVYTSDPAAAPGRMESIVNVISGHYEFMEPCAAKEEDIAAIHRSSHIRHVRGLGLYRISALAAGGAIQAAVLGLKEPCFALIRPPGHHASADTSWGFCYFNNMAVALEKLKRDGAIEKAFALDIDLHFGDGTVNIFNRRDYVSIFNPSSSNREDYLRAIAKELAEQHSDIMGISAGFDNHRDDWGGLLETEDYLTIGKMVREACERSNCGCF
ncbi:MAG: histone deacetylase family protein, partial [Desulfobacterales bacterium]|nr:histone deacetylase family protein [Desulfobacterales bacterium]